MTTSVAVFPPGFRVTDANDLPMSGAVIEFYAAGTTTPKTVYSDSDLTVPIGTSVTCDSGGYPSSGGNRVLVYVNENAYKIIGKDADDNTLWEHDDVLGAITPGTGSGGSGTSSDTFGFKVGMVALTLTAEPEAGWIRLTESAQSLLKADYPDLNTWASEQGYPWGSSSTTFNIPPAGGYFLRFGSSDGSIDPEGPRSPGSTQDDAMQGHRHSHNMASPVGQANGTGLGTGSSGTLGNTRADTLVIGDPITDGTNGVPRTATETRAKNVAMYADMLAVPALVASGLVGAVGPVWKWNSSTSASDVSSGRLALNNGTIDSATAFYISETSDNGSALSSFLQSIPSGSKVWITKVGTPATWLAFTVSSTATDAGSYDSFSITSVSHGGTLSNGDDVSVVFMPAGTTGSNGSNGSNGTDPGIRWLFASSTTMADPSAGNIRLNNATLASVTEIAVHYSSGETGNPSVSNWVKGWDDSTSTTVLGTLVIKKASAPQNFIVLHVNAALTDNTTWAQIPVTYVDSNGSFSASDVLSVQFFRAGNKGTDGAGTGDVSAASNFGTDNRILRSDGTTKGAQSSAVTLDDSGNLSGIGTLATSGVVTVGTTPSTAPKIDPSGFVEIPEISAPSTPSSGFLRLYAKSDGKAYQKNDAGTETDLSQSGGGGSSGHGQCRLAKSGSNLVLSPYNGNQLLINGTAESIPTAGVSLSASGLSVGTTYFIYAYMSTGTMTLEASTTAHATDTATSGNLGVEIKSGDATRTLVGMARVITGPAWADTEAQRFVVSYFNRKSINGRSSLSTNRTTTSTSYVEINSEIRNEFLTWADEGVNISCGGICQNDTTVQGATSSIGIDGTTAEDVYYSAQAFAGGADLSFACALNKSGLSEGYHYATLLGKVSANTGTWKGSGTAGARVALTTMIRG